MKTEDWWFKGFPAVWNVIVFYIVVFTPPTWVSFTIVLVLSAAMFLPVIFVHPVRVERWRPLTMGMLALWCGAAVLTILPYGLKPPGPIKVVLLVTAFYFTFLGLIRFLPEKKG